MKHATVLFAVVITGITSISVACQSSHQGAATLGDSVKKETVALVTVADTSFAGRWRLQPQLASDTGTGRIPEITFNATENRFTGNTGCNSMSGIFYHRGDSLHFDERIMTTKMACMGYNEKTFMDNLLRTNHFMIKDGVLQLMNNETILSKWVRHLVDQPIKKA